MTEHAKAKGPLCSWTGVSEDEEEAITCGKLAAGYVEGRDGRRIYTCEEHIASAQHRVPEGQYVQGTLANDENAPATHHGVARQFRHAESSVGHVE